MSIQSVHLCDFPNRDIDITVMDIVRDVCSAGLAIRKIQNIRVRMPLRVVKLCIADQNIVLEDYFLNIIKEELNIKEVECLYSNFEHIIKSGVSINLKICGKKYSSMVASLVKAANSGDYVREGDKLKICGLLLEGDEFINTYNPQADNTCIAKCSSYNIIIAIDTTIDNDLLLDGVARDIIRVIQQYRKQLNLILTQRIKLEVYIEDDGLLQQAIVRSLQLIQEQTLCSQIIIKDILHLPRSTGATYAKIENEEFYIMITNE